MQFCFFSKIASVLSHWTVIIPCKAQGQKPSNDTLWSPLLLCPPCEWHSFIKSKRKEIHPGKKYINYTAIYCSSDTGWGWQTSQGVKTSHFSPMCRKWFLISNKLVCTYTCVYTRTSLGSYRSGMKTASNSTSTQKVNTAKQQAKNTWQTSQLCISQYRNMQNIV